MSKRNGKPTADREPDATPETIIAEGVVEGRPIGWKSPPIISKPGGVRMIAHLDRNYKAFTSWQSVVRDYARLTYRRHKPYGGDVRLEVAIYCHNEGRKKTPDLTNAVKAFEDGLKGVVIIDDAQVKEQVNKLNTNQTERQRVEFRVVAIPTNGGPATPGSER